MNPVPKDLKAIPLAAWRLHDLYWLLCSVPDLKSKLSELSELLFYIILFYSN